MTDRDDPRAAQALDEVETRLREGELHLARQALDATRALCGSGERARFEAIEQRLGLLERLEGPALDHDAAMARGNFLAARDAAARAASVVGGEEAERWRARDEEAGARVRAEWRIREAELDAGDGGAALAACAGVLEPTLGEALPVVADDGATLVLVAALERWVFVREIDLRHRRLRRIGWLRTPEPLEDALVQVEGNSIHLVGISTIAKLGDDRGQFLHEQPRRLLAVLFPPGPLLPDGKESFGREADPHGRCSSASTSSASTSSPASACTRLRSSARSSAARSSALMASADASYRYT